MTPGQMDAIATKREGSAAGDRLVAFFPPQPSVTSSAQKGLPHQVFQPSATKEMDGWIKPKFPFSYNLGFQPPGSVSEEDTSSATNVEDDEDNEEFLEQLMTLTSRGLPQLEVEEKYSIAKELGSGSYGHVLHVQHHERGTSMALKLMSKERTGRREFLREYCIALCLSSHHALLRTTGIAFETSTHYAFAQELAPAGDLCAILSSGQGIPEVQLKRCAAQLAEALDFMHGKALVHRDIKLDNVMLFDNKCRLVKLGDFGLTRLEGTPIAAMSGTLPYSPPELCLLEGNDTLSLDSSLDVWAFGVLLFCLSTGCFPWDVAMSPDPQFEEFSIWQNRTVPGEAPGLWKGFTISILGMFRRLMTTDPDRRSPAIEVHKYLHLQWLVDSSKVTQSPLDDYLKETDPWVPLRGPTGNNTDLVSGTQEKRPGLITTEKTHAIQIDPDLRSHPGLQEGSRLAEAGLQP